MFPDLCSWQHALGGCSAEGHQGADAEGEAVVQQGRDTSWLFPRQLALSLIWVLLQIIQLEAAAQQQVQELSLRQNTQKELITYYTLKSPAGKKLIQQSLEYIGALFS